MATYVIGDIQGCYEPLMRLLDMLRFDENSDRLWCAGDLINRGPDSLKVLRLLSRLPSHHQSVLGNHDLYFLSVVLGQQATKPNDTLAELYASHDLSELAAWLRQQPLALYDDAYNTLVVHAGVDPHWTRAQTLNLAAEVEQQLQSEQGPTLLQQMYGETPTTWDPQCVGYSRWRYIINCLTRLRLYTTTGHLYLAYKQGLDGLPPNTLPWYQMPQRQTRDTRIVFGHWAALRGNTGGSFHVEAIDTGCAWGLGLTAYRLEDGQRFFSTAQP